MASLNEHIRRGNDEDVLRIVRLIQKGIRTVEEQRREYVGIEDINALHEERKGTVVPNQDNEPLTSKDFGHEENVPDDKQVHVYPKQQSPSQQVAETLQDQARRLVFQEAKQNHLDKSDNVEFGLEDVYVVWFSKTLRNWKAMVSTNLPDGKYYEVTYNGHVPEIYIDTYVKVSNKKVAG